MKKKVVKTKLKQKQIQSQKQIVNINIGDKGFKAKGKRRASKRPNKKSLLPVGPTIIMNPHTPQQSLPQLPMERQEQSNTIMPPKPVKPPIPAFVHEYTSVDYLDDAERDINPGQQDMRTARLRRFEAAANQSESVKFTDIYEEPPLEFTGSPFDGAAINPQYVTPIQMPNVDSISQTVKPNRSVNKIEPDGAIGENIGGAIGENIGGAVINTQYVTPIQVSKMDSINQTVKPDRAEQARAVRIAQQRSVGVGSEVPDELLLAGNYGLTQGGKRRTAPTAEQKQRLTRLGAPYQGGKNTGFGTPRK